MHVSVMLVLILLGVHNVFTTLHDALCNKIPHEPTSLSIRLCKETKAVASYCTGEAWNEVLAVMTDWPVFQPSVFFGLILTPRGILHRVQTRVVRPPAGHARARPQSDSFALYCRNSVDSLSTGRAVPAHAAWARRRRARVAADAADGRVGAAQGAVPAVMHASHVP